MSNTTTKRAGELLRSVFKILWDKPEGLTAGEVLSLIPEVMKLTEDELKPSPGTNTPTYEKLVRITSIPLTYAGWLIKNDKGRWYITEDGYQACRRFVNVQEFYQEALRLYNERRRVAPESIMVMEVAQESAWAEIEKHLHRLNHTQLQAMLAEILRVLEYYPSWMAPPEKQRGYIDLIAYTDPIGIKGQRILVQIKHKGQAVTLEGVKSFISTLSPTDFGMIVSMGGFTHEAMQELSSENSKKVTALDSNAFYDLWEKSYKQLSPEVRHLLPLRAINFLSGFE